MNGMDGITEHAWYIMLHYTQSIESQCSLLHHLLINVFLLRFAPQSVAGLFFWDMASKDCRRSSSHTKTGHTGESHSDAACGSVVLGWGCFHGGSFSLNPSHHQFLLLLAPKPLCYGWKVEEHYVIMWQQQRNNMLQNDVGCMLAQFFSKHHTKDLLVHWWSGHPGAVKVHWVFTISFSTERTLGI